MCRQQQDEPDDKIRPRLTKKYLFAPHEIEDTEDEDLFARFESMVPNPVTIWDICHAYSWTTTETFVRIVAIPVPHIVDITDEELLEVIHNIRQGSPTDEFLQHYWIAFLEKHTPHRAVTDLIFFDELTPEEILERALGWEE